jgi:hypothetical protein
VAAIAAVVAVLAVLRASDPTITVVRTSPVAFNFQHSPEFKSVDPRPGELLRLERRNDRGLFIQSFSVAPLELPARRGDIGGVLPILASQRIEQMRRDVPGFELVEEGKARINQVPGYTIAFRARLGERRLYGRLAMLPEPVPGTRRGVVLLLESTPAGGTVRAQDVGATGLNKQPYRSFRFGTERP